MCVRVIFFVVIFLFIITTSIGLRKNNIKKENFNNEHLRLDGSVHIKGGITIDNTPNKLRFKSLCFRKEIDGEVKEECLDSSHFSFVLNNTPDRKYFKCLGGTCIDNNHLDIIKNKKNFKLKHLDSDKCYMMRDIMLHGLGGNYIGVRDQQHDLYSLDSTEHGISRLRRGFHGAGSRGAGPGDWYDENLPGKLHDDDGDWGRYAVVAAGVDGGWGNQPWIPNALIAENCDLGNDSEFKNYQHVQNKNIFRFIRTSFDDQEIPRVVSSDTPVPQADDTNFREQAGTGFNIS